MLAVLGLAYIVSIATKDVVPLTNSTPARIALSPTRVDSSSARTAGRGADVAAMLRAMNAARTARGLARLVLDPRLCTVAQRHALDMVERNYFSHNSLDGATPFDRMKRAHVPFGYAGENLALDRSEDAAENALWRSSEHRGNMLEPHYAKVGIAAVPSTDGEIFVEDFSD